MSLLSGSGAGLEAVQGRTRLTACRTSARVHHLLLARVSPDSQEALCFGSSSQGAPAGARQTHVRARLQS